MFLSAIVISHARQDAGTYGKKPGYQSMVLLCNISVTRCRTRLGEGKCSTLKDLYNVAHSTVTSSKKAFNLVHWDILNLHGAINSYFNSQLLFRIITSSATNYINLLRVNSYTIFREHFSFANTAMVSRVIWRSHVDRDYSFSRTKRFCLYPYTP
jgi:hypothetical protein